jgi:hypothetical protein
MLRDLDESPATIEAGGGLVARVDDHESVPAFVDQCLAGDGERHAGRGRWRDWRSVLAFCDMKTLYLRNVPDDVSERLASLASSEGLSVSSFALRELTESSRRADNPALLGELPDLAVSAADVVAGLEAGRSAR